MINNLLRFLSALELNAQVGVENLVFTGKGIKMTQTVHQVTRFESDYVLMRVSGAGPRAQCPNIMSKKLYL